MNKTLKQADDIHEAARTVLMAAVTSLDEYHRLITQLQKELLEAQEGLGIAVRSYEHAQLKERDAWDVRCAVARGLEAEQESSGS